MPLFASFFLWLAHGFAWAMIPEKPAEALKPAEAIKAAEEKVIVSEDPPDAKYTICDQGYTVLSQLAIQEFRGRKSPPCSKL